jgi:hypothetical protein
MLPVIEQLNSHPKVSSFILALFSRGEHAKTLQIVQTSNVLTHLVLHDNMDFQQWKNMQEALHCSPALTELSLYTCRFDTEASRLFVNNFSSAETTQYIRTIMKYLQICCLVQSCRH